MKQGQKGLYRGASLEVLRTIEVLETKMSRMERECETVGKTTADCAKIIRVSQIEGWTRCLRCVYSPKARRNQLRKEKLFEESSIRRLEGSAQVRADGWSGRRSTTRKGGFKERKRGVFPY